MDIKKSPHANLENKKFQFAEIGMIIVLGMLLVAFEWTSGEIKIKNLRPVFDTEYEAEIIPITWREKDPISPPPPPIVIPQKTDIFEIVEDIADIETDINFIETEFDANTLVFIDNVSEEDEEDDFSETIIHIRAEVMPEFPGGQLSLQNYIANNVIYPEIAKDNGIQGKVTVQFVIDEYGQVVQVKVPRSLDPALDQAAIEVVKSLPRWKPGEQRGKAVKVAYTVPIIFKLADNF